MILLLAGTYEARKIATLLAERGTSAIASLAGVTHKPEPLALPMRKGGFSQTGGLSTYLREVGIKAIIDATHPFASQMSTKAVEAAKALEIPLLRVERPLWQPAKNALWQEVPTAEDAAGLIPSGARVFLTLGSRWEYPFAERDDIHSIRRRIEQPEWDIFQNGTLILARPPYRLEDEINLLREHGITHLVGKNSGGSARAKLDAAAALSIPVIMIKRPALPAADTAEDLEGVTRWLKEHSL